MWTTRTGDNGTRNGDSNVHVEAGKTRKDAQSVYLITHTMQGMQQLMSLPQKAWQCQYPTPHITRRSAARTGAMRGEGGWQHRASIQLESLASGKYLSKEAIKTTEKGAAGRVPVKVYRAWLVTEMERRKYRTATTLEPSDHKREWELLPQNRQTTKVARTSRGTAERRVRTWIHSQTDGTTTRPHITPPMVAAMLKTVARKGTSVHVGETLAAAIIVAEEQDLTITWRLRTKARTARDGIQQATEAMQQWGMPADEVTRMTAAARARVTQLTSETQTVAMDFGEGWGGAKEGMARVMTTYGMDTARQYKGVKEGRAVPDLRGDFGAGQGDLVHRTLKKAAVRVEEHKVALFAPNCTEESILQRLEDAQDRGKGPQAGKERSKAQQCAIHVEEVVMGIVKHREREPRWTYIVEQPKGSALAQHPLVLEHLGAPVPGHVGAMYRCNAGVMRCPDAVGNQTFSLRQLMQNLVSAGCT